MEQNDQFKRIFTNGVGHFRGGSARETNYIGALAIVDMVKSTLGPKGMDKILEPIDQKGNLSVTNDGSTILKSIFVNNPAAKIMVDISKIQDDEVGDGTTSVVVLAGELLKEADRLIDQKIHPMIIIEGFREGCKLSLRQLENISFARGGNYASYRKDLINIAKTSLSSKILAHDKDHFSNLAVDAILHLRGSCDLDMIHIIKKVGGTLRDSFLDEGFILDKKFGVCQPRQLKNARILVANTPMDSDKIKIYGAKVEVDSIYGISEIEAAEKMKMKAKCDKIASNGINCFVNRQLIYDYPEQVLSKKGIITIEHADFDGIDRLAKVLGGDIVSNFDDLGQTKYAYCKVIDEITIGEEQAIHFSGVELGEACTIVIRGASSHILDEASRSLHDAISVLVSSIRDPRIVYGGGFSEMQMAQVVSHASSRIIGKKSEAMQSFARALTQIPTIICDNAGLDSSEILSNLRVAHMLSPSTCRKGLDIVRGDVGDMENIGVFEALRVKHQILLSATEAAECIIRVDEIVQSVPRERK
jgi:T-complex protein 1 subunit beta